jgi:carbamoyl-phosphate synthase large subunit
VPRRADIASVLIIGSGPITIGQACEFDYAGTQAVKALHSEGIRVVLVNSNPATIMTDPDLADATYIEPLDLDVLDRVLARERPDALLPTLGGQTALNLAVQAAREGVLARHSVELLGVSTASIEMAEDRAQFKAAMQRIGLTCPRSQQVGSVAEACAVADELGYPVIVRASFTLGGAGGGIARDRAELERLTAFGLDQSPVRRVLVEESVLGWKEFELEVVRDPRDNCVIVCSIENIDPMGVHTGDSLTVAPAMTLTDKEYQRMRDAAFAIMREIGVTCGGSNVQFAVEPASGRMVVIEMNPRVSRSSALASKATGFPIAKIAAKLAIGYTLDELHNDITRVTPASFEPTIDYVVLKAPRFAFEKFPGATPVLGPQMKSVGEAMAIGRTFREALGKVVRSLEIGRAGFDHAFGGTDDVYALEHAIKTPNPDRLLQLGRAFQLGLSIERAHAATRIDPWFLHHIRDVALLELEVARRALGSLRVGDDGAFAALDGGLLGERGIALVADLLRDCKRAGMSDRRIAALAAVGEDEVRAARAAAGLRPVYKRVDTCGGELASDTPYLYSTYEDECEARPTARRKVIILGGGPNRIGQGIEFDYCCVHAAIALRDEGIESIMVNCNPETVSTDYDTSDRLYFEPVTLEDVLEICRVEQPEGVIVQLGGQTPLKLATALARAGVPLLGTPADAIDRAEDRERFAGLIAKLGLTAPPWGIAHDLEQARRIARELGLPIMVRPSYVLGGRAMERIGDGEALEAYFRTLARLGGRGTPDREAALVGFPLVIDRFLVDAIELDVDAIADATGDVVVAGVMEHVEHAGIHSGDSACALPPYSISGSVIEEVVRQTRILAIELGVVGLMNVQFAICDQQVYVLEVNPRASRTIPFVSKAIGQPLAKLATRAMLGRTLRELGVVERTPDRVSVKEVVLPFVKFDAVDPRLGPEMRSTGEVMGIADDFAGAFAKSQHAAGNRLPVRGTVLLAGADDQLTEQFRALGFAVAPPDARVADCQLVVVTDPARSDLRRAAVVAGIPYLTTRRAADAALVAIAALQRAAPPVHRLQGPA